MGEPGLPATFTGLRLLAQELLDRITILEKSCTCRKRDHSSLPVVDPIPSGWATAVKKKPKKKSATKPPSSPQGQPDDHKRSQSPTSITPSSDIPPIFLLDAALWPRLSKQLSSEKLDWTQASSVRDGIRIQMPNTMSFQKTINLLEKSKFPFRSPASDSGVIRAVMRGVPVAIPAESVKDDLASQGFKVLRVIRMCDRSTKKPYPLLHVTLASGDGDIFKITRSVGLAVSVEKPRSTSPSASSPDPGACPATLPQVPTSAAASTLPHTEPAAAIPPTEIPIQGKNPTQCIQWDTLETEDDLRKALKESKAIWGNILPVDQCRAMGDAALRIMRSKKWQDQPDQRVRRSRE